MATKTSGSKSPELLRADKLRKAAQNKGKISLLQLRSAMSLMTVRDLDAATLDDMANDFEAASFTCQSVANLLKQASGITAGAKK